MIERLRSKTLGLWQPEEGPHEKDHRQPEGRERRLALEVARGGVEHVRRHDRVDDAQEVIRVSAQGDGLGAQPRRAHLGGDGKWDRSDGTACMSG